MKDGVGTLAVAFLQHQVTTYISKNSPVQHLKRQLTPLALTGSQREP